MEIIRGKQTSFIDMELWAATVGSYGNILIDIGTGDGRFVRHMSDTRPHGFAIGIDACRENLQDVSRRAAANTLFVIANAQVLPVELNGLADQVTVNFPWGSLLTGLLTLDSPVVQGLQRVARPGASLEIRLNAGALAEAGWHLDDGAEQVRAVLNAGGFAVRPCSTMSARHLRDFPTTWGKRLAFGRDPRAVCLQAISTG